MHESSDSKKKEKEVQCTGAIVLKKEKKKRRLLTSTNLLVLVHDWPETVLYASYYCELQLLLFNLQTNFKIFQIFDRIGLCD